MRRSMISPIIYPKDTDEEPTKVEDFLQLNIDFFKSDFGDSLLNFCKSALE